VLFDGHPKTGSFWLCVCSQTKTDSHEKVVNNTRTRNIKVAMSLIDHSRAAHAAEHEHEDVPPSCFVTEHEEVLLVEMMYGPHSLPSRVVHFLHSVPLQILGMTLLALDILLVIGELYIDMTFPSCRTITRDATSCCNASHAPPAAQPGLCGAGLVEAPFPVSCNPYQRPAVVQAHYAIFWTSIGILSLFALELFLLLIIERTVFLRNPLCGPARPAAAMHCAPPPDHERARARQVRARCGRRGHRAYARPLPPLHLVRHAGHRRDAARPFTIMAIRADSVST
jgi:hypothetical protein